MSTTRRVGGATAEYLDDRLTIGAATKKFARKVFPDHWSFLLGEIAMYSFVVVLLTGVYLTFFFKPSMQEVVYDGAYVPLQGVTMSEAYASTLEISFEIRGGLLIRQIHHWSTLIFTAAILAHLMRIFFTGAFRKPRELNWLIGITMFLLVILNGLLGYSLPDDLLSGTGMRILEGVLLGIPVVGTYLSFFIFGGEFPGEDLIPRLYAVHVLLIPAVLVALFTAHLILIFYQKHTQYPGPGHTDRNAVGQPFLPVYTAKAGGFFFIVFGVCALLGALVQINPIWLYGPYRPDQVTAGAQPDWYMGFLEGALRAFPAWEFSAFGYTLSLSVLVPALVIPGVFFTLMALYPFIEQWVTGDKREHHVLDRPRNQPTRTGIGAAGATFFGLLWLGGGNDILATHFQMSIYVITWSMRVLLIAGPIVAFVVAKRICLGLQRKDRELLLHGRETGIIKRLPHGEFIEVHEPVSAEMRYRLTAHESRRPVELPPPTDEHGVSRPGRIGTRLRARLSKWYFGDRVEMPSPEEYKELTRGHH